MSASLCNRGCGHINSAMQSFNGQQQYLMLSHLNLSQILLHLLFGKVEGDFVGLLLA